MAGGRAVELCGSRGGCASVGRGLSGRCAVERGRGSKDLVRAREVTPVVSSLADRSGAGNTGVTELRGPRFLDFTEIKTALAREARTRGFDVVGVTRPDAIGEAKSYFERFIAEGQH